MSQVELTKDYVIYQSQTKLLELGVEIADARLRINKPKIKEAFNKAVKIRLWLKALQYSDYLDQDATTKLVLCLAQLCDANAIPYAPVVTTNSPPTLTIGGSTTINNYYYNAYTTFSNPSVASGSSTIDSFTVSSAYGAVWFYTIRSGSNQRSGTLTASWLSDGTIKYTEESTEDLGTTTGVTLSADFSSGNIRLRSTVTSGTWIIEGDRFLINGN